MKRILYFSFFTFFAANALFPQKKLDQTSLVCQYEYTYMSDTIQESLRNDLFILQIGTDISKFYSYYAFQFDSLMIIPDGERKITEILNEAINDFRKHRDRSKFLNSFPRKRSRTYIYKNYPQGKMTVTDFLGGDYVVYEDDLNGQDWQMTDSVKTILDYTCQQAVCHFRGREWTAWFAPDIPVANGPWKLGGLPGLILEAYDRGHQYHFVMIGLEKKENDPIVWGESYPPKIKYRKIDRKDFLKATKRRMDNNAGFLGAETGVSFGNDTPVYYDLIETDYR